MRADARIGQQIGIADHILQVDRGAADRRPGRRRIDMFQIAQPQNGADCRQRRQAELFRKLDAEVEQSGALDLQHFKLEHDLGLADIVDADHALDQPDHLRRIAHDEQVELVVGKQVLGLEHGFQHGHHLLGLGIGQEEILHHQPLVLLLLGRRIRINEQGGVVQNPPAQLVAGENHIERVGHRHVAQEDGNRQAGRHILVHHEIQPGVLGQRLQHLLQAGITQHQRNRLLENLAQRRRYRIDLPRLLLDLPAQPQRFGMARVFLQDGAELAVGGIQFADRVQGPGLGQQPGLAALLVHRDQPGIGLDIVALDIQHPAIERLRPVETPDLALILGIGQQPANYLGPGIDEMEAKLAVGRRLVARLLQFGQRLLLLALAEHLDTLLMALVTGTAGKKQHMRQQQAPADGRQRVRIAHVSPPTGIDCLRFIGRYRKCSSPPSILPTR